MRILLEGYEELPEMELFGVNGGSCSSVNETLTEWADDMRTTGEFYLTTSAVVGGVALLEPTPAGELIAGTLAIGGGVAIGLANALDTVVDYRTQSGSC